MNFSNITLGVDPAQDIAIPILTFCLGVISNGLAIGILLRNKFRKNYPRFSFESYCRQPSPDLGALQLNGDRRCSYLMHHKKRRVVAKFGAFHTLVLILAILDLLGIFCTTPVTFLLYARNEHIEYFGGKSLCHYSAFAMLFFTFSLMAMVMAMSLERLLSIRHPFFYHKNASTKKAMLIPLSIFPFTALVCALPMFGFGKVKAMFPYSWCFADWNATLPKDKAFNYLYVALGFMMVTVTIICNVRVSKGLFIMKRSFKRTTARRERKLTREAQMIIQLLIITILFIVCWLPLLFRILYNQLGYPNNLDSDRTAIWLAIVHPILDPWVYILFRATVKQKIIKTVKTILCNKHGAPTDSWVTMTTTTSTFRHLSPKITRFISSSTKCSPVIPDGSERIKFKLASPNLIRTKASLVIP